MNKIIKIEPAIKKFSITWMLGSFCNYDCMYCPTELHDNTSKPHELEILKKTWLNILEKTKHNNLEYKISFTGGEVTANKSFLPLLEWLNTNFSEITEIVITTNGSASYNYYKKLSEFVTAISFSTHSEFIDEEKFFQNAEMLNRLMKRPKKSFHVNVMNEFWNTERIELYKEFLEEKNISYSVNEINYNHKTRENIKLQGNYNFEKIRESQKL